VSGKGGKTRYLPLHPGTHALIHEYRVVASHGEDDSGALFRPIRTNTTGELDKAITPDGIYKLVRAYSAALGFRIGAHALRATAATNALDHQADIAKVQEWLGYANIATTRIYDHRRTRPDDSPTFKVAYRSPMSGSRSKTRADVFVRATQDGRSTNRIARSHAARFRVPH
jgi:integrase